ncbi:Regulator of chromosome condensation 1/beta-lactamase-inhibitor protein II [Pseudocohnilembus persalinus]|uniref:Regulator of chromosome condensation 1/beta-lactamase-inhibitor protein II n=1 Tax=Pseudocohnilembus persalinus TaxID=266149 RepID=A0A0V0QC13_PSEPJ|nr:Regulator of chromosome condensation 1/beta-lactamase-inhibitor protein II [Pseudocohnilembus persalinus]|eukprot:KRW99588.1 Regulator of chromosome condensation 1/beta-lactamase-inhibitor protein II [Pseudocohnilembus persalinus]
MIDQTQKKGQFGEIFLTNDDLDGGIEQLKHFRGKLVNSACGGFKKLFIIEDSQNEGIVSTLHAPQNDQYQYTYTDQDPQTYKPLDQIFQEFNGNGNIRKIVCGIQHTVILTEDKKVFTYGVGEYGSLGHGGVLFQEIPRQILKFQDKKIVQIACGEYHTLALSEINDLYAWGRGFEGQLGIDQTTASCPKLINSFFQKQVYEPSEDLNNKNDLGKTYEQKIGIKKIACGSNHSMALNTDGELYIWGEAKLGQCGTGKKPMLPKPVKVDFNPDHTEVMNQNKVKINPLSTQPQGKYNIIEISGGFGHTAIVTENGELYTWGFNIKGQLGLGDRKTRYYPVKCQIDLLGNQLPSFKSVSCGYNTTFAVDENGKLWSFGGGNLGQRNNTITDLPKMISENTQNRRFTEICATQNAAVFFAPMRIMSVRPNYGPSSGKTLITLIGTGFANTNKQKLKFVFGEHSLEVPLNYDPQTESFNCQTPRFEDASDVKIEWPISCELYVTLDGNSYQQCEQNYLIYSSRISVSSIEPKCAKISGGTKMNLAISIDELTASYLKQLIVGFQKKPAKSKDASTIIDAQSKEDKTVNPMDISLNDPELEKDNMISVYGEYSDGQITCTIPKLDDFKGQSGNQNLLYVIDVSLNGQQFTGQPNSFRFYDIQIKKVFPNKVPFEGGATVTVQGEGLFDNVNKKMIFETEFGTRLIDLVWEKQTKSFTFIAPPISWLVGGQEPTEEMIQQIAQKGVDVKISLNQVEWIDVGKFYYINPQIEGFKPYKMAKDLNQEQQQQKLTQTEPLQDPFEGLGPGDDKKRNEIQKQLDEEIHEINNLFKKAGDYLLIVGQNFIQDTDEIQVQYLYGNNITTGKAYYKNDQQIAIQIPEIEGVPLGIEEIQIELSFNGQQFTDCKKSFRYLAFDKYMTQQEKDKFENEQLKQLKAPPKKKK